MGGSSDPGSGGGGCGAECGVNADGECVFCVMWREISNYNPMTDGKKKFLVPAASDGSSSSGSGSDCGGECEMNDDGAEQLLAVASDGTSDDGDDGECEMNEDGAKHFIPMACPATGNPSSSTQETSGDSVHGVDPPPREVIDMSSSDDDDDIVREGTEESCRVQQRVTRSCTKTQKIASTSSPSAKSGPGARKPRDRACGKLEVRSKPLSRNLKGPSQRPYILSLGRTLPCHAMKKIEEKVQEIRSELPIFVKVMNISSVAGTGCKTCEMPFCVEYSEAYLPDKRQTLFLQLEGKKRLWETTFAVRRQRHNEQRRLNKHRRISEGWKEFCGQNGVEVGDICLFKLEETNTGSLKMAVYLIRKSEVEL